MAFESSGTILYVAKISYQSGKWFGNCYGGAKIVHRHTRTHTHTHTHTHRERERERERQRHRQTRQTDRQTDRHTHTHTHTEAYFISLLFLRKCRNKTKNGRNPQNRAAQTRLAGLIRIANAFSVARLSRMILWYFWFVLQ